MLRLLPSPRQRTPRPRKVRHTRPILEGLEERQLLSTTDGGQWTHPNLITYSFMPDGTNVGGSPSTLFKTMNAYASTTAWEQAIEKAAAVWQQVANINLAQVPDNGEPDGAAGDQQGDPNVGDLRIGAVPEQNGALGLAFYPPPVNGGTDAGDILFNSSVAWGSKGYDLETVALHEFGHALGMGGSQTQAAVMYEYYSGAKSALNADDSTGLQGIYGAVPAAPGTNHAASTATNITPGINSLGQVASASHNITSSTQNDWYVVTVPSNTTGKMVVSVQSSKLSSLSPRVTVYNGSQVGLGQTSLANSFGATATYTVNNVTPGQVYYIRASAANTGPGSNGAYGLLVNFGSTTQAAIVPPSTAVASQPDQGGGSGALSTGGSQTSQTGSGLLGISLGGGSLLGLNLNLLGLNVSVALGGSNLIDIGVKLQVGTLSAYGDYLDVKPKSKGHHGQGLAPDDDGHATRPVVPKVQHRPTVHHVQGPRHHRARPGA
jgi:hypothetical protein